MARVINDQRNIWGVAGERSPNVQRSDLWVVDVRAAVDALNRQIYKQGSTIGILPIETVPSYFAQAVVLPTLKVNADKIYRDTRPYMVPMYDEPVGELHVTFIMDSPLNAKVSKIYRLLDTWRLFVRAGRGKLTTEGALITLNEQFRIDYAFPMHLTLLRGANALATAGPANVQEITSELQGVPPELRQARTATVVADAGRVQVPAVENDLVVCGEYAIDAAWLSSFKMSDLNYTQGNGMVTLDATFYIDNFRDINTSSNSTNTNTS